MAHDWTAVRRNRRPRYGDDTTYLFGTEWLAGLEVEDWGCGPGRFGELFDGEVTGIDGTGGYPEIDKVTDLATYRSDTQGIFCRHVLEHNEEWEAILDNILASASVRAVVVVHTPHSTTPVVTRPRGIPVIHLNHATVTRRIAKVATVSRHVVDTATTFGREAVWLIDRRAP